MGHLTFDKFEARNSFTPSLARTRPAKAGAYNLFNSLRFFPRVFQDKQSRAHAIRGVGQAAVINVHIVDLNRHGLSLFDRIGISVRFWDVEAELFQIVRIAE